jgi:hypothetical protein
MNVIVTKVTGFNEIFDEFESAAMSKVPNQRAACVQWATQVLENDGSEKNTSKLGNAVALFTKLLADKKSEVRDAANALLAVVTRSGDRGLGELTGRLRVQNTVTPNTAASVKPLAPTTSQSARSHSNKENVNAAAISSPNKSKPQEHTVSSARAPKQTARVGPNNSNIATVRSGVGNGEDSVSLDNSFMNMDEVAAKLHSCFGEDVVSNLSSKEWQVRKEALYAIQNTVQAWSEEQAVSCAEHVTFLLRQTPGWKDSNAMVCCSMMTVLTSLCQVSGKLTPRAAYHMIAGPLTRFSYT